MHLKTRVILGVATVGAAIGATLVPATSAFAAPALTVSWATQSQGFFLQDRDVATVTGSGFPASVQVFVVECSTGDSNPANCDQTPSDGGVAIGTTDANGAFSVPLTVRTETIGSATCGAGSACFVGATTNPTAPDATNSAIGNIKFDNLQVAERTGLKNGQAVHVVGGGFKPSAQNGVGVSECTSADQSQAFQKCAITKASFFTTDANGGFTGTFTVFTGQVGSDGSKCVPGGSCIIAASDNPVNPTAPDAHIGGALVKLAKLTATKTVASAPKHVAKGAKYAVKGKVTAAGKALSGVKVTLYKVTSSGLTKIGKPKTTSSTGGVKFGGLTQKKTTKYELKTASSQTKYTAASVSNVVKVATP